MVANAAQLAKLTKHAICAKFADFTNYADDTPVSQRQSAMG
jgi:hypothetical protein